MKKIVLVLSLAFAATNLFAQENATVAQPQTKAEATQDSGFKTTLVLKTDQQSAYREIIKRYAIMVRDLRKGGLTIEQKEQKMREYDLQRDAEVKLLLTPEQFKDYLNDKEERAKRSVGLQKKQHPLGTK
ncbi:hypothetical protein KIH23_11630 [Flavobacterium sp. CYK-55]|uniref:hypothetical protein n=1 Tax=Flavobacterium sp. CYK-55 TaxID=2835529 RepID=UPI001BCE3899|nr:hypothetical protein [Flavobacterium sp. CYK-55]MBS7787947.1 hypothetical protein [Flavobacterium sp. CYK-55]